MNTIKISAVLTAALLTGALSATAFAAETLTTTTSSITAMMNVDFEAPDAETLTAALRQTRAISRSRSRTPDSLV